MFTGSLPCKIIIVAGLQQNFDPLGTVIEKKNMTRKYNIDTGLFVSEGLLDLLDNIFKNKLP